MNTDYCYYLAYGSNMNSQRLQARVPSAKALGRIFLDGYRLVTNKISTDGSAKCNLLVSPTSAVWAVLYTMKKEERALLDRVEGLGFGYQRSALKLIYKDTECSAFLYLAQEEYCTEGMLPFAWYMDFVRTGAIEHGFPKEYCDILEQWVTKIDRDEARRLFNRQLLGSCR